jgi:hypothetical protein
MGFFGNLGKIAGGVGGFILGGPAGATAGYGLANSLVGGDGGSGGGAGGGGDDRLYDEFMRSENGPGMQDAITKYTQSAIADAMPSFRNNLQLTREDGIRRGISTGDLGTSNEGDLASAFQRNISNAVAGKTADMYEHSRDRYADLLSGRMDRTTANQNYQSQRKSGLLGAIGSAAGAYFGGRNGGTADNASKWSGIGGTIGRAIGGY